MPCKVVRGSRVAAVVARSEDGVRTWSTSMTCDGKEGDPGILFRASTDGGTTGSPSKRVNDDAAKQNIQHYNPGISVAPNGRLDIADDEDVHGWVLIGASAAVGMGLTVLVALAASRRRRVT